MSSTTPGPLDPATFIAPSLEDPAVVIKGHGDTTEQAVLMEFQDCYGNTINRFLGDGTLEYGGGNGGGGTIDPAVWQAKSEKGQPNGYAPLGANGLVPTANLPAAQDLSGYQTIAQKGQANGYVGLNPSQVASAAGYIAINAGANPAYDARGASDTNARLAIGSDGKLTFGPGNAAGDANLYRSAANALKTDGGFSCDNIKFTGGLPQITFVGDTNLYRGAAGELDTDGRFVIKGASGVANQSDFWVNFPGVGVKRCECGDADSGGTGYRVVRIPN